MNCRNCGEIASVNYCSHCGQDVKVGRITFATLSNELSESILKVNKGFLYTIKELFIRPGKSIQAYLNGKRKKHYKPITYLLILSTVYFFISSITGYNTWMDEILSGLYSGFNDTGSEMELPAAITWVIDNYAYSSLLFIPVFSLASYICFSRYKVNYVEHIVINCYITGQQAILYALFSLLITGLAYEPLEMLSVAVAISYTFWVFFKFFKEGNRVLNIFRSILTYALCWIFSSVILLSFMAIRDFV